MGREAEIVARGLDLSDFNEQRVRGSLEQLRSLTRIRAEEILNPLQEICAAVGIAVVLLPELKNTGISGCARWLSDTKALIGLTLRYKKDDQLWFTVFHESGHVLLHRSRRSFIIDNAKQDLYSGVQNLISFIGRSCVSHVLVVLDSIPQTASPVG